MGHSAVLPKSLLPAFHILSLMRAVCSRVHELGGGCLYCLQSSVFLLASALGYQDPGAICFRSVSSHYPHQYLNLLPSLPVSCLQNTLWQFSWDFCFSILPFIRTKKCWKMTNAKIICIHDIPPHPPPPNFCMDQSSGHSLRLFIFHACSTEDDGTNMK